MRLPRAAPWALLALLLATWLVWFPPSPDLAAQAFRVHLFDTDGFALWDNSWYGGHYLPGYSLLFPMLAASIGLRALGATCVVVSVWAFARLISHRRRASLRTDTSRRFHANAAVAAFALGATGDLFIGRVAFALGVALGLLSVLAAVRGSRALAATLSLACAAASPVASAFLALVALADWLVHRRPSRALALGAPALALTGTLALLMPEGGYEPFSLTSLLAALAATLGVFVLVPREERLVRAISVLYALALLLSFAMRSPMGSNAVRFGVLFAPPALVGYARVRTIASATTLIAALGWQLNGPLSQSIGASLNPASSESFYTPVIDYLQLHTRGAPTRIEVPFTSSHWDATILGARFALARGWERQVDTRFDGLFYEPRLSASAYRAWLRENAVRFVALSDAPLDFSSVAEARLVRSGLPFLRLAFASAHWRVYEVAEPEPLASGPGYLSALSGDGFTLHATHAGRFLVRVHYTPYWSVSTGVASVGAARDDWTAVYARAPGTIVVDADFSLIP